MATQTYLIALGGNVFGPWGRPEALLAQIFPDQPRSRTIRTPPMGPGGRTYANAVVCVEADLGPIEMLTQLKVIERAYGRRPGRRWGARPLDLDIIGWSGGMWASTGLAIPHPAFRNRRFVLAPLAEIASDWRDPVTQLTARQLLARLDQRRPRA